MRTVRIVNGADAVGRLRTDAGLDVAAPLAKYDVRDPLLEPGVTSIEATIEHRQHVAENEGLAKPQSDSEVVQASAGDAITETWTEDGWSYSATYTFNGNEWELTAFSAVRNEDPQVKVILVNISSRTDITQKVDPRPINRADASRRWLTLCAIVYDGLMAVTRSPAGERRPPGAAVA